MRWFATLLLVLAGPAFAQTPVDTLDFAEVQPVLIGGIAGLQRSIVYPDADRRAGTQGRVIVRFVVDETGAPTEVEVVRGVSPGLDSASVAAVRAARFTPGTQDGRPVKVRFTLPVSFRIAEDAEPGVTSADFAPGQTWRDAYGADADSGAVEGGQGRVVYLSPADETERVAVTVSDGVIVEVASTVSPGSQALRRYEALAAALDDVDGLREQPDGFYRAGDLTVRGFAFAFDVSVDPARRTIRARAPQCATSGAHPDCVSVFPIPVGGLGGIVDRARFPPALRRRIPGGRVAFAVVVGREGRVTSATLSSTTYGDSVVGREIADALRTALLDTPFVFDPTRTEPAHVTIPFTFRSGG